MSPPVEITLFADTATPVVVVIEAETYEKAGGGGDA